jgi:multimeric flavodoxin WrbA
MERADILIYATPVYIFNVSGLMKTFLDRLNSIGSSELILTESGLLFKGIGKAVQAKPFVVLTCCGNVEHETVKNVLSYFDTVAKFFDAPIVGKLARKSVGMLEIEKVGDKQQKPVITDVVNAYIQAGRELAAQGRITARTQKRANRHILGIPCLDLLMKFRLFKQMALKQARQRAKADDANQTQ